MTITTEPIAPDDPSELFEQPLPQLELIATEDEDSEIKAKMLDPEFLIPVNRDFTDTDVEYTEEEVADITSSVPVIGWLQPGVAIPRGTIPETYLLPIGGRRRAAAQFLGRKLPCIIVESADTAQQILAILTENDSRTGLRPSQRASLYEQLTLLDWKPEMIARASGHKNVKKVTEALSLVQLPPAAKVAADSGQLDLTMAAELAEFADDPKTLAKIIDRGNGTWGFKHAISDARQRKEKDSTADMIFAELTMAGVKVTSKPKDFGYGSREASIDCLVDANGLKLDPLEVRTKPGFAAFIDKQAYGGPRATIYCLDPEKYGYGRAGYSTFVPDSERRRKEQEQAEQQAFLDALVAAEPVRVEFLKATYGNAKAAKANYVFALRSAVLDPGSIGIEPDDHELVDSIAGCQVSELAPTAGVDRLTRILVAMWVAADERNFTRIAHGQNYAIDRAAACEYLDRLVEAGYELSDAEAQIQTALQEQLQQARERAAAQSAIEEHEDQASDGQEDEDGEENADEDEDGEDEDEDEDD